MSKQGTRKQLNLTKSYILQPNDFHITEQASMPENRLKYRIVFAPTA